MSKLGASTRGTSKANASKTSRKQPQTFKIARAHILRAIELTLEREGPVVVPFKHYTLSASPYRSSGVKGNSGVRVTWARTGE